MTQPPKNEWDAPAGGQLVGTPSAWDAPAPAANEWDAPAPSAPTLTAAPTEVASPAPEAKGYGAAAARGVESALLPFTQSRAELGAEDTIGQTLAKAAANLATGLGVTAALGAGAAALGAPAAVAGGVAAGLYALYSGLGTETSRSRVEGKDFSAGRAALATGLELNPLLKSSGRLLRLGRVAAQVAGSGALEYAHSKDAVAAGTAALVTTALAPVLYAGMRKLPTTSVASGALVEDALKTSGPQLHVTAYRRAQAEAKYVPLWVRGWSTTAPKPPAWAPLRDMTQSEMGKEIPREFIEHVINGGQTLKGAPAAVRAQVFSKFKDYWSKLDNTRRQADWEQWRYSRHLVDAAAESLQHNALGKIAHQDLAAARNWAAPAVYVARKLDAVGNTDLEGAVVDVLRATDRFTVLAKAHLDTLAKAEHLAKQAATKTVDVGGAPLPLSKALTLVITDETGDYAEVAKRINAAAPELFDTVQKLKASLLGELKGLGYNLGSGRGATYMPQMALQGAEAAQAVRKELSKLQDLISSSDDWLGHPRAKPLVDYAERILGKPPTLEDLLTLPKLLMERVKTQPGVVAGATFTRTGEVPEFIREIDAFKLLQRYIHGNLKGALLATPLRNVQTHADAFRAMGLPKAADWVDRYAETVSGTAGGIAKHWNAGMERIREAGLELLEANPESKLGKALDAFPEALARVNALVYPAALGMSPRTFARNALQSYATTAPELGGTYGYSLVSRGAVEAYKAHGLSLQKMKSSLQHWGQLGDVTSEAGVRRQSLGVVGGAADWVNEKGMFPFVVTDLANRSVAMHTGMAWAKDLAAGRPEALAALRAASPGLKASLAAANLDPADVSNVGHILGSYLVTKTQFRYGRAAQSRLVREIGSAAGQFTMWPQMAMWDLVESAQHPEWMSKLAARLLPLSVLMVARDWVHDQHSPALEYFVGDPTELSPYPGALSPAVVAGAGPLAKAAAATPGALGAVFRSEDPGAEAAKLGRSAGRGVLKTYIPPVSAVVNEIDRWDAARRRAKGDKDKTSVSRRWINEFTGGPK